MKAVALCLAVLSLSVFSAQASDSVASKLEVLKARAAKEGWTFVVGDTGILDASHQSITGFKRSPNWKSLAPFVKPKIKDALPAHWDWRDKNVVTSIKNQHLPVYCGSCWAFGTDAVIESAIAIATGKQLQLAEQQLVSCQPSYGTCEGGDFAFAFYQQVGANYEADFPYTATDAPCNNTAAQHEKIADWSYVGSELSSPSTDDIKAAIYQNGPVAVTVAASDSFVAYSGGIYNACDSTDIDHILTLIGWDDTDQIWIVKNSWGTQWGESGFMRIKYTGTDGSKCNSIGDQAAFATYTASKK